MTVDDLKALCGDWPGVSWDVKWGNDFMLSVERKIFAGTDVDSSGVISFKVPDERFLELTDQPGIEPAPYAARFKWIVVREPERYGREWCAQGIRRSYELVRARLPKKTQRKLLEEEGGAHE